MRRTPTLYFEQLVRDEAANSTPTKPTLETPNNMSILQLMIIQILFFAGCFKASLQWIKNYNEDPWHYLEVYEEKQTKMRVLIDS